MLNSILTDPWPWYVTGPIIGLMVPALILLGSRSFGISQNLEHLCALTQPKVIHIRFFKYDWRPALWSLVFAAGVPLGGFLAGVLFVNPSPVQLSPKAQEMFGQWGLSLSNNMNPAEIFSLDIYNLIILFTSGVAIGFGTRYASGCTSGHAITGISTFQIQSFYAVAGIFSGGLIASHFIVPWLWS